LYEARFVAGPSTMAAPDRARTDGGTATTALRVGRRRRGGRRERVSIHRYQKLEKLGEGTYGRVYKALDKNTNEHVALKLVKMDPADEGVPATTLREVSVLKTLKHETIVELKAQIYENDEFYLVFEHLEYDLKKYANREHKKTNAGTRLRLPDGSSHTPAASI